MLYQKPIFSDYPNVYLESRPYQNVYAQPNENQDSFPRPRILHAKLSTDPSQQYKIGYPAPLTTERLFDISRQNEVLALFKRSSTRKRLVWKTVAMGQGAKGDNKHHC